MTVAGPGGGWTRAGRLAPGRAGRPRHRRPRPLRRLVPRRVAPHRLRRGQHRGRGRGRRLHRAAQPGPAVAEVVDRAGWVAANVRSMRTLLAPLTDRFAERMAHNPLAPGRPPGRRHRARRAARLRRPAGARPVRPARARRRRRRRPPTASTTSAPTCSGSRSATRFRPRDFRLWIALHEVTHRAQFTGVPWLREYFLAQVHALVGGIEPDPGMLFAAVGRAADAVREGRNPVDERGLVGLFANDDAARGDGPDAGADVAARRPRQRGDEPPRRADWSTARSAWRRCSRSAERTRRDRAAAPAHGPRDEDAPVRGRRGVRPGGDRPRRVPRARCGVERARAPADAGRARRARDLARRVGAVAVG